MSVQGNDTTNLAKQHSLAATYKQHTFIRASITFTGTVLIQARPDGRQFSCLTCVKNSI